DFAVYGPNPVCSNLASPLRCHYSPLGVTGVYGAAPGTAPPAYSPDYDGAFRERIPVLTGEVYYINVANYENSKTGFTLTIAATTPLANVVGPGGTLIWTGAVNTDWFNPGNWGGCNLPNCSINAIIPGFALNMPVINGAGANCRNLDINFGATLNVNTPFELNICGDYSNSGTFTAAANSTVLFQDTSANLSTLHNQVLDGLLNGVNQFWNVTVKKPTGWKVISNQDIDMAGNLLVSGAAGSGGEFSVAGKYHKVGGNFTIEVAPLVATYSTGTTLEFIGTAQTYLNRSSLNNVLMNQTGAGSVTLQNHGLAGTAWMRLSAASTLTLTNGKIVAGIGPAATNDNRVELLNPAIAAIGAGRTASYIEGTLRRSMISAIGSFDFPVGSAAKGYQRINFNLTVALPVATNYWNVYFDTTSPATNLVLGNECSSNYHAAGLQALDNGYWNVESFPPIVAAGKMNVINYNRNLSWSVALGAGWTVMYNNSNSNAAANWQLNPFPAFPCTNPLVTSVLRNNVVVPSIFTGNPVWFGTAQSQTPLPVELLSLDANPLRSSIKLSWVTASEKNNRGFDVERTATPPDNFEKMAWLNGNGSTTITHYYNFEDKNIKEGVNYYYRLKQFDFNGGFAYSNVVSAKVDGASFTFSVEPNPYSGHTNIIYYLKESDKVQLMVYNSMGQKVATLVDGYEVAGKYNFEFSAKALGYAPGIYSVLMRVNDEVYSKRIFEIQ
ncbi:MAG: T9SS type A sorting domain-containing protein, partial [Bacteroidota bacterium]